MQQEQPVTTPMDSPAKNATATWRTPEQKQQHRLDLLQRCYNVWKKYIDSVDARLKFATFANTYEYQKHYDATTQILEIPLSGTSARLD